MDFIMQYSQQSERLDVWGKKQMHAYESKENMKFLAEPNWQSPSFLPHGHNEIAMFEVNDIILCTHN